MNTKGTIAIGILLLSSSWTTMGFASEKARLLAVEGVVQAKQPGDKDWKAAAKGDLLAEGAEIQTSENSSCQIGLGPDTKSVIHMKASTHTILTSESFEAIKVKLEKGRVFALVRNLKKESKFEVISPTAIAAARGTGWEQGLDEIKVFESEVDVTGANGENMLIEEGKGVEIGEDGDLGETFDVPEDAKSEWKEVENSAEQNASSDGSEKSDDKEESQGDAAGSGFDNFGEGSEGPESPEVDTQDIVEDAKEQSTTEVEDEQGLEGEFDDDPGDGGYHYLGGP